MSRLGGTRLPLSRLYSAPLRPFGSVTFAHLVPRVVPQSARTGSAHRFQSQAMPSWSRSRSSTLFVALPPIDSKCACAAAWVEKSVQSLSPSCALAVGASAAATQRRFASAATRSDEVADLALLPALAVRLGGRGLLALLAEVVPARDRAVRVGLERCREHDDAVACERALRVDRERLVSRLEPGHRAV